MGAQWLDLSSQRSLPAGELRSRNQVMKIFFYMGTNPKIHSRVSMKLWKIERHQNRVTTWWGRARMDTRSRRARPHGKLLNKTRSFRSERAAHQFEKARIREKLLEGYERNPRRNLKKTQ